MFHLVNFVEEKVFEPISLVLFSISGLVMLIESLQRTLFSRSFEWASEISIYSMVWAILLILARAGKKGHHIRMEIMISILPPHIKKYLLIIVHVFSLGFSLIFVYSSQQMVTHAYKTNQLSLSTLQIPVWMLGSVMIITGVLLFMYYLESIFIEFKRLQPKGAVEPLLSDHKGK